MAKKKEVVSFPKGWGDDELSRFMQRSHNNELASYANLKPYWRILSSIDAELAFCIKLSMKQNKKGPHSGHLMQLISHNHLRAAIRLALAGQSLAVYSSSRSALEASIYSWYLITYPDTEDKWSNKPSNRKDMREWTNEFSFNSILEKVDLDEETKTFAKDKYNMAIDCGSHPNSDSLYGNMTIIKDNDADSNAKAIMHYLHYRDNAFYFAILFTIDIGMLMLRFFRLSYPGLVNEYNLLDRYLELADKINVLYKRKELWKSDDI